VSEAPRHRSCARVRCGALNDPSEPRCITGARSRARLRSRPARHLDGRHHLEAGMSQFRHSSPSKAGAHWKSTGMPLAGRRTRCSSCTRPARRYRRACRGGPPCRWGRSGRRRHLGGTGCQCPMPSRSFRTS